MMLTVKDFAEKHGVTPSRIYHLLRDGRITNVQKIGDVYLMNGSSRILPAPIRPRKAKITKPEPRPTKKG